MIRSSRSGIAWFWPSTRSYGWAAPAPAVLERRHLDPHHLPRRRLRAFDRDPGRLLLLQSGELLVDRRVGDRRHPALDPEAAGALQLDLRTHLDQELELDRAALLELEIPDGGIGDGLERFGGLGRLPALPDDLLQHRLPDGVAEPLPDDGRGRLARPEARAAAPAARSSCTALASASRTRSTGTVTRSDLEAESSAVFSTVIWLIVRGIYPGVVPGRNFRDPAEHQGPPRPSHRQRRRPQPPAFRA